MVVRCIGGLRAGWAFLVLQRQQGLWRGSGAGGVNFGPPVAWAAVCSGALVLLLLTFCLLLLPLWEYVVVLILLYVNLCPFWCYNHLGGEGGGWLVGGWLLCLVCLPGVS